VDITFWCGLCTRKVTEWHEEPEGWHAEDLDCEACCFCPRHVAFAPFFARECPGCVDTFSACELATQAFGKNKAILRALLVGPCPFRIEGRFVARQG